MRRWAEALRTQSGSPSVFVFLVARCLFGSVAECALALARLRAPKKWGLRGNPPPVLAVLVWASYRPLQGDHMPGPGSWEGK